VVPESCHEHDGFIDLYDSVVLLNSAASSEQVDPQEIKDDKVSQGISGEWVKVVRAPGRSTRFFFLAETGNIT